MKRALFCVAALFAVACGFVSTAAATPPSRLLAEYQPVTVFHPAESFLPASVQSFVADADLEQFAGGS